MIEEGFGTMVRGIVIGKRIRILRCSVLDEGRSTGIAPLCGTG